MRLYFLIAMFMAITAPAWAERYLTVAEALKLSFPSADYTREEVLRFTGNDVAQIKRASGVRVPNEGNRVHYAYAGEELLGVLFIDHVLGKHEIIDYVVAFSPEGKVRQVEILEYRESYGGEIRGAKWRKQFVGKGNGAPLRLNSDVYNISGATMSCRHVTEGIKRVLATFDLLCRPHLADRLRRTATAD